MSKFLDETGLSQLWEKIKLRFLDSTTKYASSPTVAGPADKAISIPFGVVDSTSTATAFTATVDGIPVYDAENPTTLANGTHVFIKNTKVTSAAESTDPKCWTLNVNGYGAKKVYVTTAAATYATTQFTVNYKYLFVYDSSLDSNNGGWYICQLYDSNTNTIGYQIRTNSTTRKTTDACRYYKVFFSSVDGTHWVPASASTSNSATSAKTVNQRPIDPFGPIVYYSTTTSFSAGSNVSASYVWQQYNLTFGYSFNRTGAALTLTTQEPVYIKCAPQADGSAIIDKDNPFVQELPDEEDGKIYIFFGVASAATTVELNIAHPIYYVTGSTENNNRKVRVWTNPAVASAKVQKYNSDKTDESEGTADYGQTDVVINGDVSTIVTTQAPPSAVRQYIAPSWRAMNQKLAEKADADDVPHNLHVTLTASTSDNVTTYTANYTFNEIEAALNSGDYVDLFYNDYLYSYDGFVGGSAASQDCIYFYRISSKTVGNSSSSDNVYEHYIYVERGNADGTWTTDEKIALIKTATTSKTGVVQLNDTLTSTSTTQAATANAVKKVKDAIPTKTSDLTNDSGFITSHQDISGKADKANQQIADEPAAEQHSSTYDATIATNIKIDTNSGSQSANVVQHDMVTGSITGTVNTDKTKIPTSAAVAKYVGDIATNKQDTISDLSTIRSGASAGATAIQPEDIKDELDPGGNGEIADSAAIAEYIEDNVPKTLAELASHPTTKLTEGITLRSSVTSTFVLTLTASHAVGWYRVMGLGGTFSGIVTISGDYFSASPSVAVFAIGAIKNDAADDIIQVSGHKYGNIDKIRLVSNEDGDHRFYLDIHKASAANYNNVYVTFTGNSQELTNKVTNTVLADVSSTYIRKTFDILTGPSFPIRPTTSTDNAIARYDGTVGNLQNSGVTINDINYVTAAKFITSGGTSSQFVKGDGTLDDNAYMSQKLLESRGENLIYNGNGFMGDNTNFPGFTFDQTQCNGSVGSFKKTSGASPVCTYSIPVNPSLTYMFRVDGKQDEQTKLFYALFRSYDVDGNEILPMHFYWLEAEKTELTQDLVSGDTVIHLDNISSEWLVTGSGRKTVINFWNYTNSKGYTYPPYTYTRNSINYGSYAAIDTTLNTITLSTPYSGATIPAGTKVSRQMDAGTYLYLIGGIKFGADWETRTTLISGINTTGYSDGTTTLHRFRPGTATVKLGFLVNYSGTSTQTTWLTNISFSANDAGISLPLTGGTLTGGIEATSFKKTGGTSSQFLKADGSVDSNTYLTDSSIVDSNTVFGEHSKAPSGYAVNAEFARKSDLVAKYEKPSNGIPKSDLDSSVQTSLGKADSAVQDITITQSAAVGTGGTTIQVDNGNIYKVVSDGEPQGSDNGYVAPTWGAMKTLLGGKVDSVELVKHKTDESDESYDTCQTDLFVDDISLGTIVATTKPVTSQRPYVAPSWQRFEEKLSEKSDKSNTYTKSEVDGLVSGINNNVIIGELPSSGQLQNRIYRVPGTNSYTDWAWDGSNWVKLAEFSGSIFMQVTEAQYDALSDSEKNNGTWYFIEEE